MKSVRLYLTALIAMSALSATSVRMLKTYRGTNGKYTLDDDDEA